MSNEQKRWQISVRAPGDKWKKRGGHPYETKERALEVARDIRLYSGVNAKVTPYLGKAKASKP